MIQNNILTTLHAEGPAKKVHALTGIPLPASPAATLQSALSEIRSIMEGNETAFANALRAGKAADALKAYQRGTSFQNLLNSPLVQNLETEAVNEKAKNLRAYLIENMPAVMERFNDAAEKFTAAWDSINRQPAVISELIRTEHGPNAWKEMVAHAATLNQAAECYTNFCKTGNGPDLSRGTLDAVQFSTNLAYLGAEADSSQYAGYQWIDNQDIKDLRPWLLILSGTPRPGRTVKIIMRTNDEVEAEGEQLEALYSHVRTPAQKPTERDEYWKNHDNGITPEAPAKSKITILDPLSTKR